MIPLLFVLACTPCHQQIVDAYRNTPMARSSSRTVLLKSGEFEHAASRTRYRIEKNRINIETPIEKGSQEVHFSIGSGQHGQSYLFQRKGKLFEAPVTYYRDKGWAMSPGYENDTNSDWTRPVDRNCIWCHATGAQPIYGKINEYANPPFRQDGIQCERCHAKTGTHYSNPVKMTSAARNDTCRQCHMLGQSRVDLPGRSFFEYKPGMLLDQLVRYGFTEQKPDSDLKVTGHFERLAMSKCQIASGDKLWCGSCHQPHSVKVRDVNETCSGCHMERLCKQGPNCQSCHMRKAPSKEAGHSIFTDHWIR